MIPTTDITIASLDSVLTWLEDNYDDVANWQAMLPLALSDRCGLVEYRHLCDAIRGICDEADGDEITAALSKELPYNCKIDRSL